MTFQTLENPIRWLFLAHAVAGAFALLILLVPIFTKKGGKTHTRTGWLYTFAMIFVGASAFVITPWRAFFDPARTNEKIGFSVFLFFIAVFTLSTLWYGLIVLKEKNRKAPNLSFSRIAPPVILLVLAVGTQIIGLVLRSPLLVIFPLIAIRNARGQLTYWKAAPEGKMHWWYAHMGAMMTACIATITAFLVTALPRLWSSELAHSPVLWIAPGLILGAITSRWVNSYRLKFGD